MRTYPLNKLLRAAVLGLAALAPMGSSTARADVGMTKADTGGDAIGAEQRELIRRQERIFEAKKAIEEGEEAERRGDLKLARQKYAFAIMNLGSAPATAEAGNRARRDLVRVNFLLYEQAKKDGDTPLATVVLEEILIVEPDNEKAKHLFKDLEEWKKEPPDTAILGNPAVTPSFVKEVNRVNQLFIESEQFLRTGQYDKAEAALNSILTIDPYNTTAAKKLRVVLGYKQVAADKAREMTRAERLNEVERQWHSAPDDDVYQTQEPGDDPTFTLNPSFGTAQKLRTIIVPELNFIDASIEDAAVFFSAVSRSEDPNGEGVSFIVNPEAAATAKRFSLQLRQVPLEAALRYVTQLAQVKYKPEEFAVVIIPLTQPDIVLINRQIPVSPDFFQLEDEPQEDTGATGGSSRRRPPPIVRVDPGGAAASSPGQAKSILEQKGVDFPPGATAVYNSATGMLQVRNTAEQIELIEVLVRAGQAPVYMVDVKTKFVEISQLDVNELTVNSGYNLLPSAAGTFMQNWVPITNAEGNPSAMSYSTALRGSQGFTTSSLDSLLRGTGAARPNLFSIAGNIDRNLFNFVISSLEQKKSFDELAAPNIRVRSGEDAKINISRTFFYPTQFDPPQSVQTQVLNGGGVTIQQIGPPTVIPAFPTEFESRDIGTLLTVKPQIGADKKTIDLALFPEITDFEGFINYGEAIFVVNAQGQQLRMTNNVINQPVFDTRRVQTNVFVKDGYTVVLGGLTRDDTQTINDKVPIIGDIPIVGRMFQSKATEVKQTNLLIFVTCQIYLNNGELLNPPDYQLVSPTTGDTVSVSPVSGPPNVGDTTPVTR